ncbi:MAG: hypothetical protein HZA66_20460 [Rhodopseudomonas palustris]|uniref:Uncharacterized protein n=1 Tax=Rhodopseudomonas palustris TaxID=1076 RepID=A0A933S157_RHOPL|nr:hypothetical protein [Rhodopseudomonas palustris]
MRQPNPTQTRAIRSVPAWPAAVLNADVLSVIAAFGLIAAIAFGAPHLRLL